MVMEKKILPAKMNFSLAGESLSFDAEPAIMKAPPESASSFSAFTHTPTWRGKLGLTNNM